MQFLMHPNEDYEAIRGQILLMDPLPSVSKACLMIERIEQQRQVTGGITGASEMAAAVNRFPTPNYTSNLEHNGPPKSNSNARFKKDNRKGRSARFCDHCQRIGHTVD